MSDLGNLSRRYRQELDGTWTVLIPGGKGPNSQEAFELCSLCGVPCPVSDLALVNGKYYCVSRGHAEEKSR